MNNPIIDERRTRAEDGSHWTLDRKVPMALIIVVVAQLFGFIWWASDLTGRVGSIEEHQKISFATKNWAKGEHNVLRANMNHNMKTGDEIKESVKRVEAKMDKVFNLLLTYKNNK